MHASQRRGAQVSEFDCHLMVPNSVLRAALTRTTEVKPHAHFPSSSERSYKTGKKKQVEFILVI
jgi:hypothetical protein